ncbi:MAG: hypothetical protein LAO20_09270 [Acidobacteriia bacterium]|nr:hypothetical protein [Terriglobia bacterium]
MTNGWPVMIVGLLLAQIAAAQKEPAAPSGAAGTNESPLVLNAGTITKTQLQGRPMAKVTCDEDGNVYTRLYVHEKAIDGTLFQVPIQQVKADGSLGRLFTTAESQLKDLSIADFFVGAKGEMYELGWTPKKEVYVLAFGDDGAIRSKTKLEAPFFMAYQFAVFKSGEFLVSGTQGQDQHEPFTAVFDASGRMVKKLSSPEDEGFKKSAETGDSNSISQSTGGTGNASVELGEAVAGSDGNVYLLRSSSPAVVYAISPAGEIVRTVNVDSGDPALFPTGMKASPGRLALVFHKGRGATQADGIVRVVDLQGNSVANYLLNSLWGGGALTCYVPPGFIFANTKSDGFVYFYHAEPK